MTTFNAKPRHDGVVDLCYRCAKLKPMSKTKPTPTIKRAKELIKLADQLKTDLECLLASAEGPLPSLPSADDLSLCVEKHLLELARHWAYKSEEKYYPADAREEEGLTFIEGTHVSVIYVERKVEK